MKKTKKLILNVTGMFLLFAVLANSVYAKEKEFIPRSPDVTAGKISVIKSEKEKIKEQGVDDAGLRQLSFNYSYGTNGVLIDILVAIGKSTHAEVLRDGLVKNFGDSIQKIKEFDWDTYIVQQLVKKIPEQKMFQAEYDNSFLYPSEYQTEYSTKQMFELPAVAKNDLVLTYRAKIDIFGNKKTAGAALQIVFDLKHKPAIVDPSLTGKEKKVAAKAAKDKNKKIEVWRFTIVTNADVVPAHKANNLYLAVKKMIDKAIDNALEDLHWTEPEE